MKSEIKNYSCPSGIWEVYGEGGGAGFFGGIAGQHWTALGRHDSGRVIEAKGWSGLIMAGWITSIEFAFSSGVWRNLYDSKELEGVSVGASGGAGIVIGAGVSYLKNLKGKGYFYCAELPFRPRVPKGPRIKVYKVGLKGVGLLSYSKIMSCKLRSTDDIEAVVKELDRNA